MNITHLTSAHDRYDIRIFVKMCTSLAKVSGYNVSLVVADGLGDEDRNGVKIFDAGPKSKGRISRMTLAVRNVYRLAKNLNSDIYHLHDPELIFIGVLLKLKGKKVIFDAHEDLPKQILGKPYLNWVTRNVLSWIFTFIEFTVCRVFDYIITATPIIATKFKMINSNTLDINNYPILGELRMDVPWSQRKNEICYIGGIAEIRGIREMIKSLEKIQVDTTLHLVGDFSEVNIKEEVMKTAGWSKVKYHGNLNRKQVAEILSQVKCGLVLFHPFPNHTDAQPNKMFEYMSAGIPILTSDFPLWRQIVEGNDCGLCVNPMDTASIAQSIDTILTDDNHSRQKGENGFQAVVNQYNWAAEEKKLYDIYKMISLK